jgi:superfamily II DNA or RNA helicase
VICDEAHHAMSDEWQKVLQHFSSAKVLGVTATPDRADKKNLGGYFQNVAFEIGLLELIGEGYLCPLPIRLRQHGCE